MCLPRAKSSVNWFHKKLFSQILAFWLGDSEICFDISQSNCLDLGNQFWEIAFYEINQQMILPLV